MFKVDFIGLGAPKAGTTWISQCLDEHPQICHARRFETVFFESDNLYRRGLAYYETFFAHYQSGQIRGEFTPTYLYSIKAAERIKATFPVVKLLVCLRNPIERAYSHYTAHWRHGKNIIWLNSFDDIRFKQDNPYFQRGLYYDGLKCYLDLFGSNNILIMVNEDIKQDPLTFIRRVYSFLGVDNTFVPPSLYRRINAAEERGVYSRMVNQWLVYGRLGRIFSGRLLGYRTMRHWLKTTGLFRLGRKTVESLNRRNKPWRRPVMPPAAKSFLQQAYRQDIAKLENLLSRKLDFWQ